MRAYPEWTSGTDRDERLLMGAVPGLMIKGGAEGVDAFALADGRAGAVKIDDGAHRRPDPGHGGDAAPARRRRPRGLATAPVIGGEAEVGVIRAVSFAAEK